MTKSDPWRPDELIFLPLGGTGEIGMNFNLYGFGGKWLAVDLGVMFGDDYWPGIDVITPDPGFIEERQKDLVGLVLTHAHEDHLGAVPYLWEGLRCPVYATPFTAGLLRHKLREAELVDAVPLHEIPLAARFTLGPFDIEYVSLTHSIPEPNALAIRTKAGTIWHTGDWKLDPDPLIGEEADEAQLRRIGDEGVLAMVCDSTNVLQEGRSGSEAGVYTGLLELVRQQPGRVAVTCFSSNLARLGTVAKVAKECDRHVVLVGRSLHRMYEVAGSTGYGQVIGQVVSEQEGSFLPPDKVLYLCTGSQGEPRGAMTRIAAGDHRHVSLEAGDTVIFSSKVIPGNELAIGRLQDRLALAGVHVFGEQDADVHVSGHPCRDELAAMYQWIRPQAAVPVHGEARHLLAHRDLAQELQVPHTPLIANGQVLKLAPGTPEVIGEVHSGRFGLDGDGLVPLDAGHIAARRRLGQNGGGSVTLVADDAGTLLAEPSFVLHGLFMQDELADVEDELGDVIEAALAGLAAKSRRQDDTVCEAVRVAVRRKLRQMTGKRPVLDVRMVRL